VHHLVALTRSIEAVPAVMRGMSPLPSFSQVRAEAANEERVDSKSVEFEDGFVVVGIWWKPAMKLIAAITAAAVLLVAPVWSARAYYDKQDFAEVYFILPNESAFFIPDAGANRDTQTQFGSEEYLKANKIPAKRFQIPHAKLSGSSYSFWSDFYVPTGAPDYRRPVAVQSRMGGLGAPRHLDQGRILSLPEQGGDQHLGWYRHRSVRS
jgi:hypothetical protein